MHGKHQPLGGSADGRSVSFSGRDARSRPSLSVALVRSQPDSEHLRRGDDLIANGFPPVVAGQLTVRWERQDAMLIMWLSGALDQATVTLLDRELDGRAVGLMGLVVDLTGLVFIDATGLDALVGMQWRASRRGDRLSFRHGRQAAQRPVRLTRTVRLRSRWAARAAGSSDEDFYFALAMACVDVDHPWSGDRPEAA
jgi:anti-anti-sigma factor